MAKRLSDAEKSRLFRLHDAGWSNPDIAAELDIALNTVCRHVRDAGYQPNTKRAGVGKTGRPSAKSFTEIDKMMRDVMGDLGYPNVGETPEEAGERARQRRRRQFMARMQRAG